MVLVCLQVVFPYLKTKLDFIYEEWSRRVAPLYGHDEHEEWRTVCVIDVYLNISSQFRLPFSLSCFDCVMQRQPPLPLWQQMFVRLYSVLNGSVAFWAFLLQVWYLYKDYAFFTPALRLQGLVVRRLSMDELVHVTAGCLCC